MTQPEAVLDTLRGALAEESDVVDLLERSVKKSRERAEAELNADLFAALPWPTDVGKYESYRRRFLIPAQVK